MDSALRAGMVVSGFEIVEVRPLEELKAHGIWARHRATGAQAVHILNDDEENLFSFAFATAGSDSTGVAHILEHSVLCGSHSYPLKDAFIILAQGSLQTFLNAMTFPDKTVYPAASTNERDYFNLMSVYGDAVFKPLLPEWTFRQEGHRLEFAGDPSALNRTGVVYNEMKGNYSSMDSIAADWTFRSVLPGTPYAFDSGGDPEKIPDLAWEDLKAFHGERYVPANCRIFLCGNIPTERQFAFLNDQFLSKLAPGTASAPINTADRWSESRRLSIPYPASGGQKSTVLLSWLCSDSTDSAETMALAILTETLLGHDGSPLTRTLVESRLGEDVAPSSGLEGDLRETVFSVGLRGVESGRAEEAETLILDTLRNLAQQGLPKEEVEAALLSLEFSNREVRRAGGPYSLVWMRRALRGWLHGAKPWDTLLFVPPLAELKRRLAADGRYLESLIDRYLVSNPHRALVSIDPEIGMTERQEAVQAAELKRIMESLSPEELKCLQAAHEDLERIQSEADTPEALSTIPHLSRSDLSREIEAVPRSVADVSGIPFLGHDLYTNGIAYVDLAFPVDTLSPQDYLWLPFFSRTLTALGLPGMDYGQVSSLMARTLGGFHALLHSSSPVPGAARTLAVPTGTLDLLGRDWLIFRVKALDGKIEESLDLVLRMLMEADFSDLRRIQDLMLEYRNDFDSSLAPSGHSYAAGRAGRGDNRTKIVEEIWSGLSQFEFSHQLSKMKADEAAQELQGLRSRLIGGSGLIANATGSQEALQRIAAVLGARYAGFGSPRPRSEALADCRNLLKLGVEAQAKEVHGSASLQVGFAALAIPSAPFASREQAAELVLAHRLSTGALWEDIRMKGGAYGAFAHPDGLEPLFTLATYRDPNPARSLAAFPRILREAAERPIDGESLEKAIIGSYSKETRPRTGAEKGMADFMRFLTGIDDGLRRRRLSSLIDLEEADVRGAAGRLEQGLMHAHSAVVAGNGPAAQAAEALGVPVRALPV